MSAERAWAYAMDIKNEIEQSNAPAKRHHMIRRISKAAVHAKQLMKIVCQRCCDTRSNLEADAYCAWMTGTMYLEKGTNWEKALLNFDHAKNVLNELFKVSDYDQRVSIRHLLDQVEPSARFCEYQLGRSGQNVDLMRAKGDSSMLASQFEELATQNIAFKSSGAASEVEWNGETHPVRDERCKVKLMAAQELTASLNALIEEFSGKSEKDQDDGVEIVIQLYDKTVNAFSDVRNAAKSASQSGTITESQQLEIKALEKALEGVEQEKTLQRNTLLARVIESRLNRALRRRLLPSKSSKDKSEKPARPEELVRLYETLIANATALNDLAAESGGAQGEILMDVCTAKLAKFQAYRCYFIAHKYLSDKKYPEAHALFERAQKRCATAVERLNDCVEDDDVSKGDLESLKVKSKAFQTVCIAEYRAMELEHADSASKAVETISLDEQQAKESAATLLENLNIWESFAGDGTGPAKISKIPPHIPYIPIRPIVLDNAILGIEAPSLEHRVVQEPSSTSSVVSRIFGWS